MNEVFFYIKQIMFSGLRHKALDNVTLQLQGLENKHICRLHLHMKLMQVFLSWSTFFPCNMAKLACIQICSNQRVNLMGVRGKREPHQCAQGPQLRSDRCQHHAHCCIRAVLSGGLQQIPYVQLIIPRSTVCRGEKLPRAPTVPVTIYKRCLCA